MRALFQKYRRDSAKMEIKAEKINRQLKKNFSFAFIEQAVSLVVSCVMNLLLPKYLSINDYSYWQLFVFYANYVPCLALGLNDGIYLRLGGADIHHIDYRSVKSQFCFGYPSHHLSVLGFIYQGILAAALAAAAVFTVHDSARRLVILCTLLFFLVYTCHTFFGYVFQAVNETNLYSKSIIINRLLFLGVQCSLIMLNSVNVYWLMLLYILMLFFALFYLLVHIYPFFKSVPVSFSVGKAEGIISIKTGISLMAANICSILILGAGRQIIDFKWGILAFGKVSFSLTLINIAVTFASQTGMVLFPALRRMKADAVNIYFRKLTDILFYILPLLYILYFPFRFILNSWLPDYAESIGYLSVLLPICFFDCKMNLIGITFFKVIHQQAALLKIEIFSLLLGISLGIFSAYIMDNLLFAAVSMTAAVVFRAVISDMLLGKILGIKIMKQEIADVLLAVLFAAAAYWLDWKAGLALITAMAAGRVLLMRVKCTELMRPQR
jgi:O-antigen/teichoic acid export membrane protein